MSFVHLQITTAYSLLSSTISIKKLVEKAKELQYHTLAITDRNVLYGVIPFYKECIKNQIKPIIGLTIDVISEMDKETSYPLVLLAKNTTGYNNLLKLSSTVQTKSPNGIPIKWLKGYHKGLFGFTPGINGEIEQYLLRGEEEKAEKIATIFKNIFEEDSFYFSIQNHQLPEEKIIEEKLVHLSKKCMIKLIVTNDVQYLEKSDSFSHECLLAINENKKLSDDDRKKLPSEEYDLKDKQSMVEAFSEHINALENTVLVANSCQLQIEMGRKLLPKFPLPPGETSDQALKEYCEQGLRERFDHPEPIYWERLSYELTIINQMKFSDYFLIVSDFMKFARNNGILTGPGRGSAAGSLVAYVLKITNVDPIEHDLLFERFLNPERITMPDIDIDFPDHRRDEVIQYVTEKYGQLHVAQIITFGTFAAKAAARDVARVFGFNTKELEQLSRMIPSKLGITLKQAFKESKKLQEFVGESELHQKLFQTALKIEGIPRHVSTHAAGVVISEEPLVNLIPIQDGHTGSYLTQYPMDILEEIGLLKMDFLGLRNLSLIERIVASIQKGTGSKINIDQIPLDDEKTYQLLSEGNTTGIFQLESEGMRSVLKRLKPTDFEDIVAVNALYRPGPMENIPLYIDRKHGKEMIQYPHQDLEPILKKTYGVIIYQEQIMQIASRMAGFSLGEADLLRRAVSKKKKDVLDQERIHFVKGAINNGYNEKTANEIYDLIVRFANYGFNRSHAVAYSFIAYQLAYLKAHFPLYFMASLLTSAIGNADKIAQYIREAKQMNIQVLPPSINKSHYFFKVEKGAILFSLAAIKGLGGVALKDILHARASKPFSDLFDFCIRTTHLSINRKTIENLVFSGAFDEFQVDRATLLASIDVALQHAELVNPSDNMEDLFSDDEFFQIKPKYVEMEPISIIDKLSFEKQVLGLYLSDHPIRPFQDLINNYTNDTIISISNHQKHVKLGVYLNEVKTIRTKKGEQMCFVKISDSSGEMEGVLFPKSYRQYSRLCKQGQVALLEGTVEVRNDSTQLIIQKMIDMKDLEDANKKLFLRIPYLFQSHESLSRIKEIIQSHHGSVPVILFYEHTQTTIQLPRMDWVNPTNQCLEELVRLLGKQNVILQ
ncbi:DNA polymerase III subunit alpha [Heyndrickxia sporothermodurans]|uniref:DNA polymerase III subunit alpha n=1 Tax=Heyndrickxia sporothermodurans TaxID=46224 RepID=UPI0035E18AB6